MGGWFVAVLSLDQSLVERAREAAQRIVDEVRPHIEAHTTTSIERTVCRLFGVDGVDDEGVPLPNVLVDHLHRAGVLGKGAAFWVGGAVARFGLTPQEVAQEVARGKLDLVREGAGDEASARECAFELARAACNRIRQRRLEREEMIRRLGTGQQPWIYVIAATGNIYEDVVQAKAAAEAGADVVAVIRSTAQSLLDYVPYGATTEGYGGTYATQENFRIMRQALDEVSERLGRYVMQTNYCSGLCMPEIAAMGALERLDMMLNDAMYGILFRDINPQRTLVDQWFSRMINGFAGIIINTGEDNYLTTDDAYEAAHTVIASQFINERFALESGIPEEQIGLGHAFQMDPWLKDGLLYEIAQAQLVRQLFPRSPVKFMPPTKHKGGDIFHAHVMDAMFNLVSVLTGQSIHLVGMLTEAIHTPYLHDRYLSIANARYVMNNARHLGEEISFRANGAIQRRASEVLRKAVEMLKQIEELGLFGALERGMFARVKRPRDGGKGLDGVIAKAPDYFNPFPELMLGRG
ncbi:MAG: lysine 5,6-aminomutase subunit alpha [Bacillota bacterium]